MKISQITKEQLFQELSIIEKYCEKYQILPSSRKNMRFRQEMSGAYYDFVDIVIRMEEMCSKGILPTTKHPKGSECGPVLQRTQSFSFYEQKSRRTTVFSDADTPSW